MTPQAAAEVARDALIWLAGQPETLERFLRETGAEPAALRMLAARPEKLGFVLDFLLGDDALVCSFAAEAGLDPAAPARARDALEGGALPNWT